MSRYPLHELLPIKSETHSDIFIFPQIHFPSKMAAPLQVHPGVLVDLADPAVLLEVHQVDLAVRLGVHLERVSTGQSHLPTVASILG
jgi:hypothetical protein